MLLRLFGSASRLRSSVRTLSLVTFVCVSAGSPGCPSLYSANFTTFCFYTSTSCLGMTLTLSPDICYHIRLLTEVLPALLSLYNGVICTSHEGDILNFNHLETTFSSRSASPSLKILLQVLDGEYVLYPSLASFGNCPKAPSPYLTPIYVTVLD